MPWDEVLLAHAEAQAIEASSGVAPQLAGLLADHLAAILGALTGE